MKLTLSEETHVGSLASRVKKIRLKCHSGNSHSQDCQFEGMTFRILCMPDISISGFRYFEVLTFGWIDVKPSGRVVRLSAKFAYIPPIHYIYDIIIIGLLSFYSLLHFSAATVQLLYDDRSKRFRLIKQLISSNNRKKICFQISDKNFCSSNLIHSLRILLLIIKKVTYLNVSSFLENKKRLDTYFGNFYKMQTTKSNNNFFFQTFPFIPLCLQRRPMKTQGGGYLAAALRCVCNNDQCVRQVVSVVSLSAVVSFSSVGFVVHARNCTESRVSSI